MASPIELKISRYLNGDLLIDTLNGSEITLKHTYNPIPGDGETDITETINLILEGAQSTVQSTINSINRYMADVKKRNENGYGDRVYLEARAGTAAAWRRSEIIDGRLSLTDDGVQAGLSSGTRTPATLTVTRRGWWENTSGTNVPLTNENGTATGGSYLPVYNCLENAGTAPTYKTNYVKVASGNIQGDLPVPVKTYIQQVTAATNIAKIYAGRFLSANGTASTAFVPDPYPYYYHYSFTGYSGDSTCENGTYAAGTITTSAETKLFSVPITYTIVNGFAVSIQVNQLGGAPFHVMIRFRNNTNLGDVKFRLKYINGTTALWTGPQFTLSSSDIIQDLGVVNLPPGLSSMFSGGELAIYGTRITGDTEVIQADFVEFFGDNFAKLQPLIPAATNLYFFGGGNKSIGRLDNSVIYMYFGDVVGYGAESLVAIPGRDNGYFFLAQTDAAGTAPIANNMSVMMTYRPRWSSPL